MSEGRADERGGVSGSWVPDQIGRYPVSRRLGSGAFATVWLGHDPEFDIDVAIKVLADNWAADPSVRERFVAEARFLRRIRDRRVVHVYDIGTLDDGRPYFVMDHLDAGSLEDLRHDGVAPAEALRLCADAAGGLGVLHRHHLVHRDVTPGNLLLSRRDDGSRAVVVADLGVARSVVDSSSGSMIVGTPSYMAPEQAGSGAVDHRADLYALCAVAYALLAGAPPFPISQVADLTNRPPGSEPAPIAAQLGAPATLDGLFVSGLATDPHRRPPTAAVLAEAFERLAEDLRDADPPTGPQPEDDEPDEAAPSGIGTAILPAPAPTPQPSPQPQSASSTPARATRSSVFYVAMTALAVLVFVVFLAVVIGLSL